MNDQTQELLPIEPGIILSRANYPINIKFVNDDIILSPRQKKHFPDVANIVVNDNDLKYLKIIKDII